MKRYEKYKDSGVKWLGKVPDHWEVKRFASYFQERRQKVSDKDFEPLSVTKNGIMPQLANAAKSNDGDNRKLVKKGDFVINSRSDRKGSSGVSPIDGSVSLINIVLEPSDIEPAFCSYLLKSYAFIEEYYRVGRGIVADLWTTRYDEMKLISLATPQKSEQQAIAEFLDEKTTKIDHAISIKEKEIELLKERRQILIQELVTGKKIWDGNQWTKPTKTKDSGLDWIGEIPEDWVVRKLRNCLRAVSIKNRPDLQLLSITRERGVIVRNTEDLEENHNFIPDDLSGYKVIRKGQFGMNKMKAWQGSYGISDYDGIVSPAYFIFDVTDKFIPEYFHLAIRSKVYVPFFTKASDGVRIGQWDLNRARMNEIPFFIPNENQQIKIVSHVNEANEKIEYLISLKQQEIEKLKEYKTILIDNAVTGKMKVC